MAATMSAQRTLLAAAATRQSRAVFGSKQCFRGAPLRAAAKVQGKGMRKLTVMKASMGINNGAGGAGRVQARAATRAPLAWA
jgi:hypothetical protein